MLPLGLAITAPFAGRLADHIGARPLTIAGMITAGAALAVSTIVEDEPLLFLAALAVTGIGLGAFTPPNNAAIMGAAPRHQTGMASGILNMTRGLGTSLGLALAGLAYTASAGPGEASAQDASAGYDTAALFLASVAVIAAVITALRGRGTLSHDSALTAE